MGRSMLVPVRVKPPLWVRSTVLVGVLWKDWVLFRSLHVIRTERPTCAMKDLKDHHLDSFEGSVVLLF